jgi:hypothetical protein
VVECDNGDGVATIEEPRRIHRGPDSGNDGAALGGQGDQAAAHVAATHDCGRRGVCDGQAVGAGERREGEDEESCDEKSGAHAATTPAESKRVPRG